MKRFLTSTYYTSVIVVFLLIAVGGFTQTKTFRSYLRGIALEEMRKVLDATVDFGVLEGNLVSGFQISNVVLAKDGREIFYAERLEVRYDPGSILLQRLALSRLTLLRPRIHLWRGLDGDWNVDRLILADPDADTASSPLTLDVRLIEIEDAAVEVVDSLALSMRTDEENASRHPDAIDYARFTLSPLSFRGGLHVSDAGVVLSVRGLDFQSAQPRFHLVELKGEIQLRPGLTEVRSLAIRTEHSRLSVSARMVGKDVTSIDDVRELEKTPVELDLNVDRLDFREFKQFLPGPVDFLAGSSAFSVKASGEFGNLAIREVVLKSPRTYLNISGVLKNLHRSRDLEMDLTARDNIIHPADLRELLPGLRLPDFDSFGVLSCSYSFNGTPEQFKAGVQGKLNLGEFFAEGDLDLRGRDLAYEGTITTADFDPGKLLGEASLSGTLNSRASISGSGTSLETMTTVVRLQADSSAFLGLPVQNSIIVVDIADRSLRSNLLLQVGPTRVDLNARSDFHSNDSLTYTVQGTVNSLDLASLTGDNNHSSDLSFTMALKGKNLDISSMKADAKIHFLRSSFRNDEFEDQDVVITYDAEEAIRSLSLQSHPIDVEVGGRFTPASIVNVLEHGGRTLSQAVSHRFATFDSLRTGSRRISSFPFRAKVPPLRDTVSANVAIRVRDLYPLGSFLNQPMYGTGEVHTTVNGSPDGLSFSGGLSLPMFVLGGSPLLDLTDVNLEFSIGELRDQNTLEGLRADLRLGAGTVLIDSTLFNQVSFRHQLRNDSSSYALSTMLDSTIGISFDGTSRFIPNRIELSIPTLRLAIADHAFENPEPLQLRYGRDGLQLNNFILQHEAEEVALSGLFNPQGPSDISYSIQNFLLNNLQEFSRDPEYIEKVRAYNGVVDLDGTFRGDFDHPEFEVSLKAQGVTMGETVFGQITGRSKYRNGMADLFLEFMSRPNEPGSVPELFVSGIMPLELGEVESAGLDRSMNLTLRSNAFRLEFLDPFVSVTSKLKGAVSGNVAMRGTLKSPLYEGSLSIQDAEFNFVPLGITYRLHGQLVPEGKTFRLEGVTLSNVPEDRVPALVDGLGSMSFGGRFTLEGIVVRQFDISANGQLLVMKESIRLPDLPMHGNVYVGTGVKELRWFGAPERSFVTGDLLIKNATMTFPPSRDVLLERARMYTVDFIDDTSKAISSADPTGGRSLALANGGPPPIPSRGIPAPPDETEEEQRSFLDNIVYNLALETAGLTQVRFVFNQLTNEELSADLKGRLVFTKDESGSRVTGELEVGQRSYYKYFKTLQATGKLLFTGDITNPELDIVATYEGSYRPADSTLTDQNVIVRLAITGTRSEPKVVMGLETYDRDGNKLPQRADVQSDAIAFLVSGTFKDEMTQGQESNLLATSLLGSIGSSLLSGPLTDLVRNQVGYITSIDVYYYGGGNRTFGESADIRLTGEVGDAVIRLGGRVLEDVRNTNVSIQFPMSSITGSEAWRNLILELERRSEGIESFEQRRQSNGLRLLYRISF